ncbi:Thoeris anti-defense Tad2 family protein [Xenorhabdus thuongxuanensis]|uniref:DUF2829 domain-containing protein n=2 Tax=Xenorhabdus thuongxuanensis TaxID=1873484 RepID=A0A1Q5TSK3_9GAMM|nr:MW1434 family type I TA system toxin [Xenorhabdus thuongxuanensis]OKP03181.1 hypothetical protein Xentx_03029 [Xenorhabdus thuongxuanensis]
MSELSKPENMNASLKCPFNPDQYRDYGADIIVPAGSFAWALSKVYLGKQVHRSGWNAPIEHMRLAYKSEVGSADDGAAYIEKSDKDGYWSRWTPIQEDLMACDWKLLQLPESNWMSFDLEVGMGLFDDAIYNGYISNDMRPRGTKIRNRSSGTLSNFQNNITTIREVAGFIWDSDEVIVGVSCYEDGCQKAAELLKNSLSITLNGKTYNYAFNNVSVHESIIIATYSGNISEFNQIAEIGKTQNFHLSW